FLRKHGLAITCSRAGSARQGVRTFALPAGCRKCEAADHVDEWRRFLSAIPIALCAAFCWGASAVMVRTGLRYISSTATGTLISLTSGLVFSWLLVLIFERDAAWHVSLGTVASF